MHQIDEENKKRVGVAFSQNGTAPAEGAASWRVGCIRAKRPVMLRIEQELASPL